MSETDVISAGLERYQQAGNKLLLVLIPGPDKVLNAEDLALGLRFLSDLILYAEAADQALDMIQQTPTFTGDYAFAHSLRLLQDTSELPFMPLENAQVLAMGIGSPAWLETILDKVRTSLFAVALGVSGVAVTGVVAVQGIGAIERSHAREITLNHAETILTDKYVPVEIKRTIANNMFGSIEKLDSTVALAQRGVTAMLLPADDKSKQSLDTNKPQAQPPQRGGNQRRR